MKAAVKIAQKAKSFLINLLDPVAKRLIYTVRHGFIRGCKRRGGFDFLPKRAPATREAAFLAGLNLRDKVVYDIGGFEGLFTLYFSMKVGPRGRVFTFEPNPVNAQTIAINLRINKRDNVRVFPVAIGKAPATMSFVVDPRRPASGSLDQSIQSSIVSNKRSFQFGKPIQFEVSVKVIDMLLKKHAGTFPVPDFVKIDVEGFEMDVLRGMADTIGRRHPLLFIEIHGTTMERKVENVKNVASFLVDNGYQLLHVETGKAITKENAQLAAEGHLYATEKGPR